MPKKTRTQKKTKKYVAIDEMCTEISCNALDTLIAYVDKKTGQCVWDEKFSHFFIGKFDSRTVEQVFIEDGIINKEDSEKLRSLCLNLRHEGSDFIEVRLKCKDNIWRWYKVFCHEIVGEDGKPSPNTFKIIFHEAHNEIKYRRALKYAVDYDKMTGLLNEEAFFRKVREIFKGNPNTEFAIIIMDIERFKEINSILGSSKGNEIIRYIANEIKFLFAMEGIVGRLGSDIFAVCVPKDKINIDRLLSEETGKIKNMGVPYEFSVATGIYLVEDKALPIDLMCEFASLAAKKCKKEFSKKVAYYDGAMLEKIIEEQNIVLEMENALKNKEFKIYLQPQYSLVENTMTGAEALVRWEHPTKGIMSPAVFIPIFEKNGFITKLDLYMIEEVCALLYNWVKEGRKLVPISVNVSRVDMFDADFTDKIVKTVNKYGIEPRFLELELTESAYIDNPYLLSEKVASLQAAGFKILMDDFGSGYSSLNLLKDIPVDMLKIDLNFLNGIMENKKGGSILTSIMNMAKELRIPTIAEGVEYDEQAKILSQLGCNFAQGYLYGRPVPVKDFVSQWLEQGREKISDRKTP